MATFQSIGEKRSHFSEKKFKALDKSDMFDDSFFTPAWDSEIGVRLGLPPEFMKTKMREMLDRRTHWSTVVNLQGFRPEDIDTSQEGSRIHVHARHEDKDGFRDIKKTVLLPDNVDYRKVNIEKTAEGMLVVRAPFDKLQDPFMDDTHWPDVRELMSDPASSPMSPHLVTDASGRQVYRAEIPVREFLPSEIHVQQRGNRISVTAEHKESKTGQIVQRKMDREFTMPSGADLDQVSSKLLARGWLQVEAPISTRAKCVRFS